MDKPKGDFTKDKGVNEDFLLIQKARYHFMSRHLDPQVFIEAEEDMQPTCKEPNSESFKQYLQE